jgi:peptide chain release factor 2
LRIDYYRAGGAGGQHVNKTESAVRITHLPTGIVAQCQNERSQHKNKSQAMRVLRARLYEHFKEVRDAEAAQNAAEKKKIEWGSQIRSYVLAPYRQVTDHRTDLKVGNVDAVLDGDLDRFIRTYLLATGS